MASLMGMAARMFFLLGEKNSLYCVKTRNLSLLAMVDCWAHLGINPYIHLSLAATPIFRLFLGVAEYLLLSPALLSASIHSALFDTWHRAAAFFEAGLRCWEARCGDDQDGHRK
jgi:hypothetical protein